jgi:hypothetical protein
MNTTYLPSFRRRVRRRCTELNNSLGDIRRRIVAATERAAQRAFNTGGSLVPIPVRAAVR